MDSNLLLSNRIKNACKANYLFKVNFLKAMVIVCFISTAFSCSENLNRNGRKGTFHNYYQEQLVQENINILENQGKVLSNKTKH